MSLVDPFIIRWPERWLNDLEIRPVVNYLNQFLHDLWVRSGQSLGVIPISGGGTGATTEAGARANLGLEIGTDVQAYSIYLDEANTFFIDTDITGTEAETLTDGSNADTLHVHAHDQTEGLQGGTASEYYHLTQTQHDTLTDGSDAIGLHTHNTEIAARLALRI